MLELGFGIPELEAEILVEEGDVGMRDAVEVAALEDLVDETEEDSVLGMLLEPLFFEVFFEADGVELSVLSLGIEFRASVSRESVCLDSCLSDLEVDFLP